MKTYTINENGHIVIHEHKKVESCRMGIVSIEYALRIAKQNMLEDLGTKDLQGDNK